MIVLNIKSHGGTREFNVRRIAAGESYGLSNALTADKPLVEFWDTEHRHTVLGQFTGGRYYESTILDTVAGHGLDLNGGVPAWTVDGFAMAQVRSWLRTFHDA